MTIEPTPTPAPLARYLWQFTGLFVLLTALAIAVPYIFNFDLPSATAIIVVMASAAAVGQNFARKEGRAMAKGERLRFANLGTLISMVLTLGTIFLSLFFLIGSFSPAVIAQSMGLTELPPLWLLALLQAVAALITWLVLYFGLGFFSKQMVKQMNKRAK